MLLLLQPDSSTSLESNTALTLRLDGKSAALLTYTAPEVQTITLTVRAISELDPVVELLTPDGQRLAYNDDASLTGLAPTDAALVGLTLPEAGDYTVRVNTFNGVTEGEVEVLLTVVDSIPATISEPDEGITTIQVQLPKNGVYRYELPITTDQMVQITARDPFGGLDPVLTLRNAAGEVVTRNDDHNSTDWTLNIFDAQLKEIIIPADGVYTLELREFIGRAGVIEITIIEG